MNYDGLIVAATVAELRRTLLRGRVQKIRQHNDTDLTLEVRAPGHTYLLFLSVDARIARAYLTASSLPVPDQAPNFCMLLRKYVQGAFVTDIAQVAMDRIMWFHLDSAEHGKLALVLEIMGKHSNLILLNDEKRILGAAKHVGSSISRYRQVLPGRDYISPPSTDKTDPRTADDAMLDRLWPASLQSPPDVGQIRDWLLSTFSGFGPFLAEEIVSRSLARGDVGREAVTEELRGLRDTLVSGSFEPVFVTDAAGRGVMAYPMPTVQFPSTQQHPRASLNEALDTLFRTLVSRSALDDERTQTLTAVRRAVATRKQTLKSIERTLDESEKSERYKQLGELLLANLHAIAKGDVSADVTDFFDPSSPEITIELDAKLSPQENAERYFKRYRKSRDAAAQSVVRKQSVLRELGVLEAAAKEAESAQAVESLRSLRKMLTDQGVLRQEVVRDKHEDEFGGFRIRRVATPEGWEILYGESSLANDHLTLRVARPNDLWLHARQITGAHVIIRTAGQKGDVPRPVLIRAALIAAQNSDAKHSSLVPVDYTPRKYVRKPRGGAPGFVTYRNEKTIDVSPAR